MPLAYSLNRNFGVAHCMAAPSALIGASNFFEPAVATSISLFGVQSGTALATAVGVLVEAPVMLPVVKIAYVPQFCKRAASRLTNRFVRGQRYSAATFQFRV